MNQLQKLFQYEDHEVRVVFKGNDPWFVVKDVCTILEIGDVSSSLRRLDDDEKGTDSILTIRGQQNLSIVNESGLYSLVLGSRKPEAKSFKRWITHEVIPSIRKHGMYATDELLDNPDLLIQVATKLKEERQARIAAEAKLEEQRPLVSFAETCLTSKDNILVREVAKIASKNGIVIGEKRLYRKLREWGLIMKDSTEPLQKSVDAGYFEIKQGTKYTAYEPILIQTTMVTPKGQVYIIERLKREMIKSEK